MSLDQKSFTSPPDRCRGGPFWVWNDGMEQSDLTDQIEAMATAGWGAFFIHSRYGLTVDYLSDEWLTKVEHSVDIAADLGLDPWLYDEHLWPSGFADGEIPSMGADYRIKFLLLRDEPKQSDDVLDIVDRGGEMLYLCQASLEPDEYATASGDAYTDLMNPDVVTEFIRNTHDEYAEALGEQFGDVIPGIFTDEPQIGFPGQMGDNVRAAVPWTVGLPTLFREEHDYDVLNHLSSLFFAVDTNGRDYRTVRYDFWRLITERFVENFTARLADWCDSHDLQLTGHYLLEDTVANQIPAAGAVMPHYEHEHMPGIDFLGRFVGGNGTSLAAKQASSAARQFDRIAMSELYGCSGQQFPFEARKWLGDWHLVHGITFLNHHLSLHSMRGERKRDYPPNIFYQQPWWDYNGRIAEYFARAVYALREGSAYTDTLVVHPVQTGWINHDGRTEPADISGSAGQADGPVAKLDEKLAALVEDLLGEHVHFDLGDELLMEQYGSVSDGNLSVGEMAYSTVVVPYCQTLQSSTVDLLVEFVDAGGDVVIVGDEPTLVDGRPTQNENLDQLSATATHVNDADAVVPHTSRPVRILDADTRRPVSDVRLHVRELDDGIAVFAANTSSETDHATVFRFAGEGAVTEWDLLTGDDRSVETRTHDGETLMEVDMPRSGSVLLTFTPGASSPADGVSLTTTTRDKGTPVEDWSVTRHSPNALVIDECDLVLDGQQLDEVNVAEGWVHPHDIDDPEMHVPFSATYRFDVDPAVVGEQVDLVVESGDEVTTTVNGTPLSGDGDQWRDINWHRYEVTDLVREDENEVVIEGTRDETAGVEPIFVLGDFRIVDPDDRRLRQERTITTPEDVTESGYPFYTGELTFEATVPVEEGGPAVIEFDEVHGTLAEVRVNGGDWRELYWPPWNVQIDLDDGENTIEVRLVTSLRNLTGPHHAADVEPKAVSPWSFRPTTPDGTADPDWYDGYHLVQVGIEGVSVLSDPN